MRRSACLWGLLLPTLAFAAPRDAVVAAGDCRDPDLIGVTRDLLRTLAARTSEHVVPFEELAARLAPAPAHSEEELRRQLEAAQMQFYSGEYGKAEQELSAAAADIDKLPPGKARVELLSALDLTYGLLLKGTGRQEDADERFAQVLRIQPEYRMDPDYFSPLTRRRFDRIRRALAVGKRQHLVVKSTPAGAEVTLDGKAFGRTPLSIELPPAVYALRLAREGALSFPHTLDLHSDQTVVVDLAFEGAVQARRVPCVVNPSDENDRLSKAARVGNLVQADDAVVLRLDPRGGGPTWLTATLIDLPAGQKIREGSLKLENPNQPAQGLDDLVTFLLTGQPTGNVVAAPVGLAPVAARRASQAAPEPYRAAPVLVPDSLPQENVLTRTETPWRWKKTAAYGASGLGVALLGVGTAMELSSANAWSQFDGYYTGGKAPSPDQVGAVATLRNQAQVRQQMGAAALITGAVALGTGVYLYLTRGPGE